MWGWTLHRNSCFALLDQFYAAGYRQVDAATNYPINKNPEDFRAAEKILLEWIRTHGVEDLEVIMKVGSINNLRSPEHNLRQSFLLFNLDHYRHQFGTNLRTFMIHWDNRNNESEISDTLEALRIARDQGLETGLSGIKHPEVYARLNALFQLDFRIQIKHNLFYSDVDRYPMFQDKARFLAYGINAGGVKLDTGQYQSTSTLMVRGGAVTTTPLQEQLRQKMPAWNQLSLPIPIQQFNQLGMINAYHHPKISGILVGPSKPEQLRDTLAFFEHLKTEQYRSIYKDLQDLS